MGMIPSANASLIRSAVTRAIRAFVCELSVMMPTWRPVKDRALMPRPRNSMASSAIATRSPVDSSMSISRSSGQGVTSCASRASRSVSPLMAESTTTRSCPACLASTTRSATR